ncbi:MAG: DUF2207 domain-containing protein [Ilumatobacter sp.]|uniref:DUF2207 family protein n=1 Tax=Ilumatobacter sp. TaxID=1967498 RepID=UPI00262E65D8|nr:DUF2207 domain-containing protein [Ilumatobacter sp.]MDJ0767494.1 DUF2207 domain-containing protein [Ilumatobacter sp.]
MTVLTAFLHRPTTSALVIAIVVTVAGWAAHRWAEWSTRPTTPEPGPARRPKPVQGGSAETPAVIALLTNGFDVPKSAVTATALDLAARGWIRVATTDQELVVMTRGSGEAGDSLRSYEQQVLNHLASRAFNDVASANTLAMSHHRLNRRWWTRFGRSVAADAQEQGLCRRRYTPTQLVPPAALAVTGLIVAWVAARGGDEIALTDSWASRAVWIGVIGAAGLLAWRTVERAIGSSQRPTEVGTQRTSAWLGYRQRLRDRIPAHASVLAPPPQQLALAHASVMGVAEHVLDELPAAPEDHGVAWSEAGGRPHIVRVHYPVRPGFGQHPVKVAAVGVVLVAAGRWLNGFLQRVADGESLESLLERVPGQVDLIEGVAEVLAILCWIPILGGIWAVIAGAVDSIATRERVGAVVRARRPVEVLPGLLLNVVKPFAERDRFSTYLAVDDGRRVSVSAWLANERSAAPQGAQARVRATPLLGYVRSSEPVGTAARGDG